MILLINTITIHRTIKMKLVDVKDNTYVDSNNEVNDKDPKFKVGDHVGISKYKNIFAKGYMPNWSAEVFVISKLKVQFYAHMLLMILMVKNLLEHFMKKNCRRLIKNRKVIIIHLIVGLIKKIWCDSII